MGEKKIEAKLENLEALIAFVNTELEKINCPRKMKSQIDLAVEEVFVNISSYAYQNETGFVLIRADAAAGNEIRIEFEDAGMPYNPLTKDDPDISAPVEDRPVGGLGIFMVKKIMDTVEYSREGNRNILVIRKAIPRQDGDSSQVCAQVCSQVCSQNTEKKESSHDNHKKPKR